MLHVRKREFTEADRRRHLGRARWQRREEQEAFWVCEFCHAADEEILKVVHPRDRLAA
jgi:hypothetical protein